MTWENQYLAFLMRRFIHWLQLMSLSWTIQGRVGQEPAGAWEYDIVGPWTNGNMTDVMAGIGLAQLSRYDGILRRRKEIIMRYDEAC